MKQNMNIFILIFQIFLDVKLLYLQTKKKNQWALESDCCSFVRGFSEELLLQYDKQKKSLNINRKPFKIKYMGIELLTINQLIFEHINRGPPTLIVQI